MPGRIRRVNTRRFLRPAKIGSLRNALVDHISVDRRRTCPDVCGGPSLERSYLATFVASTEPSVCLTPLTVTLVPLFRSAQANPENIVEPFVDTE